MLERQPPLPLLLPRPPPHSSSPNGSLSNTSSRELPRLHYRRRYNENERLEVKAVRAIGACGRCQTKRVKCDHARAKLKSMQKSNESPESDLQIPTTADSELIHSSLSSSFQEMSVGTQVSLQGYVEDFSDDGNPVSWYLRSLSPALDAGEELTMNDALLASDTTAVKGPPTEFWYARKPLPGENEPFRLSIGLEDAQPRRDRSNMISTRGSLAHQVKKKRAARRSQRKVSLSQKVSPESQPLSEISFESLVSAENRCIPLTDRSLSPGYLPPQKLRRNESQPQVLFQVSSIRDQFPSNYSQHQNGFLQPNLFSTPHLTQVSIRTTSLPTATTPSSFYSQQQVQQPKTHSTAHGQSSASFTIRNCLARTPCPLVTGHDTTSTKSDIPSLAYSGSSEDSSSVYPLSTSFLFGMDGPPVGFPSYDFAWEGDDQFRSVQQEMAFQDIRNLPADGAANGWDCFNWPEEWNLFF